MPSSTATCPKYKLIRERILAKVQSGEYPVESQLPSIGEACQAFGGSYVTTQRAYALLAEEGVVRLTKGHRAVVVRSSPPHHVRHLAISGLFRPVMPRNDVDNFALVMVESVCHSLADRNASVVYRRNDDPGSVRALIDGVKRGAIQGLILDQIVLDETLDKLAQTQCPAVVFNRNVLHSAIGCVAPDMEWIGRETGRMILSRGYNRVILGPVSARDGADEPERRIRMEPLDAYFHGLRSTLAQGGMAAEQVETAYYPPAAERECWDEPEYFRRRSHVAPPRCGQRAAYVTAADMAALRILNDLTAQNVRVPQDAGVLGLFNFEQNRAAARPVTTWHIDPAQISETACDALLESLEFPERRPVRRYVKPRFVEHGTF